MQSSAQPADKFPGAIHLFRVFGIHIFLHWSWLIVALLELQWRHKEYRHVFWNIMEYLTLFGIVLLHELGHALACRSVGGRADRILLWPLGGVAFVDPPQRPGPVLWSIAAGPLVNVVLIPVMMGVVALRWMIIPEAWHDCDIYLQTIVWINIGILIFNMLPIYPLDGGQIFRSLLWFFIGRIRSLYVAATIGMAGAIGVVVLAIYFERWWLLIMAIFGVSMSWRGLRAARALGLLAKMPRHSTATCPSCHEAAPAAPVWRCSCEHTLDMFAERAWCPRCGARHAEVQCPFCGKTAAVESWFAGTSRDYAGPFEGAVDPGPRTGG